MASPWYCDLGAAFVAARDGDNSGGDVLTGPGGYQQKISGWSGTQLAAGEIIYLKGTADLSKFVKIRIDKSPAWDSGDNVRNDTGNGDHWEGTLVDIDGDWIYMQLDTLGDFDAVNDNTGDGIENTTKADTAGIYSPAYCLGIVIDGNSGTIGSGWIKHIGVNSGWSVDGTQFVLDGVNQAASCIDYGKAYHWFEHMEVKRAVGRGIDGGTSTGTYLVLVNADLNTNGGDGIYAFYIRGYFFDVRASNNTGDGFGSLYYDQFGFGVEAMGNGAYGIEQIASSPLMMTGVVMHNNTSGNVKAELTMLSNFVLDSSSGNGIDVEDDPPSMFVCGRITNHATGGKHGLDATSYRAIIGPYVYFGGNDDDIAGDYDEVAYRGTSKVTLAGSDTGHGYEDQANDDFNLASGATYRSEAMVID